MTDYFSFLASIIAIISFIFYLFGSIIKGIQNLTFAKRNTTDCFIWSQDTEITKDFKFAHPVYLEKEHYDSNLIIYSTHRLYDFEIRNYDFNGSSNSTIYTKNIVDVNECIVIQANLPEGIPQHKIYWTTPSYMKASLLITYNGKDGNTTENIIYKHTFKSFFYYFFQK